MAYRLSGLIGRADAIARTNVGRVPIALPQGFTLARTPTGDDRDEPGADRPFWWLGTALERAAVAGSAGGPLAYVEAEFFGGVGRQAAAVWSAGTVVWGPVVLDDDERPAPRPPLADRPINQALRRLGVVVDGTDDEFTALGLDHLSALDLDPDDSA